MEPGSCGDLGVTSLRVVIADDHLLVREGVRSLLVSGPGVEVVGEAGTADELLELVDRTKPNAVLTDIRMPPDDGLDGIVAALEIRARWPDIGVVVLSQHLEDAYPVRLFAEGTAGLGYLLKQRIGRRDQIVSALVETAGGGSVLDPRVVESLVAAREKRGALADLTSREREVLGLMAEGLSNPSIAQQLHLSLSSVEKVVGAVFMRLGLAEEPETNRRVLAVLRFLAADRLPQTP